MAQPGTKRARPAFSPPRPKTTKAKPHTAGVAKARKTNAGGSASLMSTGNRGTTKNQNKNKPRKQARALTPLVSASESDEEEGASQAESASLSEPSVASQSPSPSPSSSPEPEFMLAEVRTEPAPSASEIPIPLPLLHKILQHTFQHKDKTRISTDAREVLGKYVEVFVREAIMRSSFEGKERAGEEDTGRGIGRDDGWLEVEDLEKVGAQLCLDF